MRVNKKWKHVSALKNDLGEQKVEAMGEQKVETCL